LVEHYAGRTPALAAHDCLYLKTLWGRFSKGND
jgi:hypothetical protein